MAVAQAFVIAGTTLSLSTSHAQTAALPSGGQVRAGSATIGAATGNALTITQTSQRAAIDWRSFSVGAGHSVNFIQPNAGSAEANVFSNRTIDDVLRADQHHAGS
jgi:large exoprotein involved in heme utilization and adhesion